METLYTELDTACRKMKNGTLGSFNASENQMFDTIYIGGGTPSFIDSKYIEKLIAMLHERHMISDDAEITIEVNPCTVTEEKIQAYQRAGINRISIGLQTTNDTILHTIGRAHTFLEFEEAYGIIRKAGFCNVNVDLMFGLPGQTLKDLKESLNYLIGIQPEHISCYSLILHHDIFQNLPPEEVERQMYYDTKEALKNQGFEHYEISNFAKKGYESRHNLVYWNQGEYIGIGAGASSYVNHMRYTNEQGIESYIAKVRRGESIQHVQEVQNMEDKVREYMILKLRLISGVDFQEAREIFHFDVKKKFEKEIEKLVRMGLLHENNADTVMLTEKGLDFANVVWREFI